MAVSQNFCDREAMKDAIWTNENSQGTW